MLELLTVGHYAFNFHSSYVMTEKGPKSPPYN